MDRPADWLCLICYPIENIRWYLMVLAEAEAPEASEGAGGWPKI
jgi:hypothetical protein